MVGHEPPLARWGRLVHRRRVAVLGVSIVLFAASGAILLGGASLAPYAPPDGTESARGADALRAEIPGAGGASFVLLFTSDRQNATDPAFRDAVESAIRPLRADARVAAVVAPWNASAAGVSAVSADGRRAIVLVLLRGTVEDSIDEYASLRGSVASDALAIEATGELAVHHDFDVTLARDLRLAEVVALPLSIVVLLVVFGSIVAALLPVGVGILAVSGGLAAVFVASRLLDVNVYAVNVVTLIGLGLAIDYSLFIVNRYREELLRRPDPADALAATLATAGRATAFSALTVAVGLLGLAFYRGMYFASMGIAGALVVVFAVGYALTFLPALLAILGPRVNRGAFPLRTASRGGWTRLAHFVMRRPAPVLGASLVVILVAASPVLALSLATGGVDQLPESAESHRAHETIRTEFPARGGAQILVLARFPGDPLEPRRVAALANYSDALARLSGVLRVESFVDLDPTLGPADYARLYSAPEASRPPEVRDLLSRTAGERAALLVVVSEFPETSEGARAVVRAIRAAEAPADGSTLVTGFTAGDVDTIDRVEEATPLAVVAVVAATYALLFLQTRSYILPLKAVFMNFLSIGASFGAMVWVFQEGNLAGILGFTPGPLDPSLPILLFCIVFGLSMDYEVLLLSRIQEAYRRSGDNARAVAEGLERSGRLITGAALIMVIVFGAFVFTSVVLVKAIGLGLALAVAVDATLVRALVVPATMRLLGRWNWWGPRG